MGVLMVYGIASIMVFRVSWYFALTQTLIFIRSPITVIIVVVVVVFTHGFPASSDKRFNVLFSLFNLWLLLGNKFLAA